MKYLLDAKVFRKVGKRQPQMKVRAWLDTVDDVDLAISALTVRGNKPSASAVHRRASAPMIPVPGCGRGQVSQTRARGDPLGRALVVIEQRHAAADYHESKPVNSRNCCNMFRTTSCQRLLTAASRCSANMSPQAADTALSGGRMRPLMAAKVVATGAAIVVAPHGETRPMTPNRRLGIF